MIMCYNENTNTFYIFLFIIIAFKIFEKKSNDILLKKLSKKKY